MSVNVYPSDKAKLSIGRFFQDQLMKIRRAVMGAKSRFGGAALIVALGSGLFLAACGGGDDGDEGPPTGAMTTAILSIFGDISQIPRCSKNEAAISS